MEIKGLTFYFQEKRPICLSCSLNTLLTSMGECFSVQELIREFPVSALHGTDLLDIISFLKRRSFEVFPFISSAARVIDLIRERLPLLVWFQKRNAGHVGVVYGFETNNETNDTKEIALIIHDPGVGRRIFHVKDLDQLGLIDDFNGYCFYMAVVKPEKLHMWKDRLQEFTDPDPFFHNIMGEWYYFCQKDPQRGLQCWRHALMLKDNYSEVFNNLAIYYLENETEMNEALRMAKKACELFPNEVTYTITLGKVYRKVLPREDFFLWITDIEKKFKKNIEILRFKRRMEYEFGGIKSVL